jgi:hypothetical protein
MFLCMQMKILPPSNRVAQLPYQAVFEIDDEIEAEDGIRYNRTPTSEWTKVDIEEGDESGRRMDSIEWTEADEVEPVNITDDRFPLVPLANIVLYNWDGQTFCPQTDCFPLDTSLQREVSSEVPFFCSNISTVC